MALCLLVACGDDDSGVDAGTDSGAGIDAATDAGVDVVEPSGPECNGDDLFIVEIDPGESITLLNPTSEPIDVAASTYQFCQAPQYAALREEIVIAPGARQVFAWPEAFRDGDERGEVALYVRPGFEMPDNMLDIVCWGLPKSFNRLTEAGIAGLWEGDCADPVTGEVLKRVPASTGTSGASYDPTGVVDDIVCPAE